jgi:hypothetical protein
MKELRYVAVAVAGKSNSLLGVMPTHHILVHWMYTTEVRPIITYAAMIWWPRLKYMTSQAKLSKL